MSSIHTSDSSSARDGCGKRGFGAVLFDLYDTLIWLDVEKSNARRRQMAERMGVSLERFMAVWRRSVDDRMLGRGGSLADHLAAATASLGLVPDPSLLSDLVEIERNRLRESVHLYPDVVPFLQRLRKAGYRLGLLSNVSDGAAIPIAHLGIDRLFDELILSHEVGLLKPDPAIYLLACRRLACLPQETVFVADGGFGELDAAQRLGIYSVMLEQDHQSKEYGSSTSYDLKIRHLRELEPLLGLPSHLDPGGTTCGLL
ncbi:MAG: HAD family hydrolase [Sphingomonadaceae bacterium]